MRATMAKYIDIDIDTIEEWLDIMMELWVGLAPSMDREKARAVARNILRNNHLTSDNAAVLGRLLRKCKGPGLDA